MPANDPEALLDRIDALEAQNARLQDQLRNTQGLLDRVRKSSSWRLTAPLRAAVDIVRSLGTRRARAGGRWIAPLDAESYRMWVTLERKAWQARRRALLATDRATPVAGAGATTPGTSPQLPLISFLMRIHDEPEHDIRSSIESLLVQPMPAWQLCLVDGASAAPHVARLIGSFDDARIRAIRLAAADTAGALDEGLAAASGRFVAVLEPGDLLAESALVELTSALAAHAEWRIAYSDEDRINAAGERCAPRFKTGWNPDLLLTQAYIGRLCVMSRDLVLAAGGFRHGFEGAEEHDVLLRVTAGLRADEIGHIPRVLCHRPDGAEARRSSDAVSRRAVEEHVHRLDPEATVHGMARFPNAHRIIWSRLPALVSVIVPTRDRADLLRRCIADVLAEPMPAVEVIVVDNGSSAPDALALLEELAATPRVRVLTRAGPFNWSILNNEAAAAASGEVLVLLNNDIETIEPGWLRELCTQAMRPAIGAVGAKLLFADGRVQHAGVWLGPEGLARHLLRLSSVRDPGYEGQLVLARDLSAVTGACLALRREVFLEVGGLDPALPVAFNDIDLCLRVADRGYRILWTPDACLRHLESASRGQSLSEAGQRQAQREHEAFRQRWGDRLNRDPFFNPNLDLIGEEILAITHPPRWNPIAR